MNVFEDIFQNCLSDIDRQIIEEAREVFLQRGYSGTNVDMIAQKLNIGKGTIYRHFKSKSFLFLAVVIYTYREILPHFEVIPHIENPHEAFQLYLENLITLNLRLGKFFSLLNPDEFGREFQQECMADPHLKIMAEKFKQEKQQAILLLASLLEKLQKEQSILGDVSSISSAHMILALANNYIISFPEAGSRPEETRRELFCFIYRGLGYKEAFL